MVDTVDEQRSSAFGARYKRLKALWHVLGRNTRDGIWWVRFRAFEVSGVLVVGDDTDLLGALNRNAFKIIQR